MVSSVRGSWWSVTINNPEEADRVRLAKENLPTFVKAVHYQEEIGEEGTPHIQAAVNTAQIRFSAIKEWLPRAHIELARDKNALLKYVKKTETAVEGTQVAIQAEYITMDSALMAIAEHPLDREEWTRATNNTHEKAFEKAEYWRAVRIILYEKPKAVGLFTNPQLERAWINTRDVWILLLEEKRQADRQELEKSAEKSPAEI